MSIEAPVKPEAVEVSAIQSEAAPAKASTVKAFFLRWGVTYFALFFFPMPFSILLDALKLETASHWLDEKIQAFWLPLSNFVAANIFHVATPLSTVESGSGDKMIDYARIVGLLLISPIIAGIWTAAYRAKPSPRMLHEYLRVTLRYSLAIILMAYGFGKTSQFPAPREMQQITPLGMDTPMGMLWNFMGSSYPYTLFSGILEISAGVLMLFRRTTTLGAILGAIVLTNVFALNICYDVPVKLYSFHYLLGAVLLLAPEFKRLANVFIFNRPTEAVELTPPIARPAVRKAFLWAKVVVVLAVIGWNVVAAKDGYAMTHPDRTPVEGIWAVKSFKQNGAELDPAPIATPVRWRRLSISNFFGKMSALIEMMGPRGQSGQVTLNGNSMTLSIFQMSKAKPGEMPPKEDTVWTYRLDGNDHLILSGKPSGVQTDIDLARIPDAQLNLMHHKIHWIQERPRTP